MKDKCCHLLIPLILFLSSSGCAVSTNSDFGRLVPHSQVSDQFQGLQILRDHRYYYSGEILIPDAIIAIHKDYIVEKGFWTEIRLTEKQLKEWMWMFSTVEDTYDEDDRITINYEGYVILSPEGTRAGVYYSKYNHTVVKFPGGNRIIIYKPEPPLTTHMLRIRAL